MFTVLGSRCNISGDSESNAKQNLHASASTLILGISKVGIFRSTRLQEPHATFHLKLLRFANLSCDVLPDSFQVCRDGSIGGCHWSLADFVDE